MSYHHHITKKLLTSPLVGGIKEGMKDLKVTIEELIKVFEKNQKRLKKQKAASRRWRDKNVHREKRKTVKSES